MNKAQFPCMIPAGCPDLNELFSNNREADKARALLHYVYYVSEVVMQDPDFAPGIDRSQRWCPVVAENLRAMVRNYSCTRKVLEEHGIIEIKRKENGQASYFPGKFSMLYRTVLTQEEVEIHQARYRLEYITTSGVVRAITRYHRLKYERQKSALLTTTPWYKGCLSLLEKLLISMPETELKKLPRDIHGTRRAQIESFNTCQHRFCKRDEYGKRIHTHLTNLPKDLRPFLTIDSEDDRLALVDVSCCQPYLLSAMFKYPDLLGLTSEFAPVGGAILLGSEDESVMRFFEDCRTGQLYDQLVSQTGMDRDKVKQLLIGHVLFAAPSRAKESPSHSERSLIRKAFKTLYQEPLLALDRLKRTSPSTLPFVCAVKTNNSKKESAYQRMRKTPNMMAQRLESAILLDRVTKTCLGAGIELATIHDAWLLRERDIEKFKSIFQETFDSLGVPPPMTTMEVLNGVQ